MNASVATFPQIFGTGTPVLPVAASGKPGLALGTTKTGAKAKDLERSNRANLAKAFQCIRAARRNEREGFPCTAAMKWRNATELFAPDTRAVEYCWHEWARIMGLPRRLAGPIGFFTSAELPLIQ